MGRIKTFLGDAESAVGTSLAPPATSVMNSATQILMPRA